MNQLTLFDSPRPSGDVPIARNTDPQTSHDAARKTKAVQSELQAMCLGLWVKLNADMTVKEVASQVMARCFPEISKTDERYPTQLDNCRKRANEVANKHCMELQERRNGCRVFRLKEQ